MERLVSIGGAASALGVSITTLRRFYPSSKTCSACGEKLVELPLSVREWTCSSCGVVHDRDLNAAVNLRNMAVSSTVCASPAQQGMDAMPVERKALATLVRVW